jgi:ribosomal protein L11 methyltransferase
VLGNGGPTVPPITVTRIENIDWNAEWENTIRPIRVGRRIVIAPSWHPHNPGPDDVVLTIDPKMSFGTGYHESTRLIIRMLEDDVRPGARVLDIGTGTGVLAIAALKLGAATAVGVDIDEWSEMNARENAGVNGVAAELSIVRGTLADIPRGTFDLVLANIQRFVLVRLMPEMAARLDPSGTLLLSGLLIGDEEEIVREAQSAGLAVARRATENEWLALSLRSHIPTLQ